MAMHSGICKEFIANATDGCIYTTREDNNAVKYICDIPIPSCQATICMRCVESYTSTIPAVAIAMASLSLLLVICIMVYLSYKARKAMR